MRKLFLSFCLLPLALPAQAQVDTRSRAGALAQSQVNVLNGVGGGSSGGGTQRLETVPAAIAPSVYGANPCTVGGSAGLSAMGFGASGGVMVESRECRDQEWFRFLHMAGQGEVAKALICDSYPHLRRAYALARQPCPQGLPAVAAEPRIIAAEVVTSAAPIQRRQPDWCLTASASERRTRRECRF